MAWDPRDRAASSSRGKRAAMKELESSSSSLIQAWACSSLSSSEKFLSRYDKMPDDRGERKNLNDSPVASRCVLLKAPTSEEQQEFHALLPPTMMIIEKSGSKLAFPYITSRGSLIGKKMSCRTSIRSSITWRQKNCSQRMCSSLLILNSYNDRSGSNRLYAVRETPPADSSDSVTISPQKQLDHSLEEGQCRSLVLSLAGAAGMRLICPPLQLPLLEILLFFRQQLSSKNRATAVSVGEEGGLWRFPVNLALATLRPFTGSLVRRCLTALLCLAQMRIKKKFTTTIERQKLRYMPADLYSVVFEKERHNLDRSKEFASICSVTPTQMGDSVVKTATEAADDATDRATRRNHNGRQFLSNGVVVRSFEEQCCGEESWSKGVPVMEILISGRREVSLSDIILPGRPVQQDQSTGDVGTLSEEFQIPLSDLKEVKRDKLVSIKSFPEQKSEDFTAETVRSLENGFVLSCKRPHIVSVEEPRNELSFAQSGFAVSQSAGQVRLEFPASLHAVKVAALERGTISAPDEESGGCVVEDNSMTSTDGMSVVAVEDEPEESTFISPTNYNLKETIDDELAGDDAPYSPRGAERNEAFVKDIEEVKSTLTVKVESAEMFVDQQLEILERTSVTVPVEKVSLAFTDVVVENQPIKDILEVNSTRGLEGNSIERAHNEDREANPNEVQRFDYGNCVFSERLQGHTGCFRFEKNSAESKLAGKELPDASAEVVRMENPLLTVTEIVENEAVKEIQEMPVETLSMVSIEGVQENEAVKEIQKTESVLIVNEKNPTDQAIVSEDIVVSPVERHIVGDSATELLDRFHSDVSLSNLGCAGNELHRGSPVAALVSLPVKAPSLAAMEELENEAVKEIQEVKFTHAVKENSAARVLDREIEVGDSIVPEQEGTTLPEPFAHTSLTSRLNTATEAQNSKALDPGSGATAVVMDELNRDPQDGRNETEANALNVIHGDTTRAHDEYRLRSGPTETAVAASVMMSVVTSSDENYILDQSIRVNRDDNFFPELCLISSPTVDDSSTDESGGIPESYPEHHFADHPMCVELRECRHSHGDQTYLDMQELLPPPWGQLIFWHGRCKEGRPTLCVLLGKAVRQLPNHELKHFIAVTVSHLEYAELNYFKGNIKQMNILMDLEGLGFMRLPPMHILSSIGAVLNRDYAGRGGWIILVNAPVMLGFVIGAIQGVIFHNKGDLNTFKGFLEGKERIMMMGHKYRPVLEKHFDTSMLSVAFGGDCPCGSGEEPCRLGNEFLKLPWDGSSPV